MSDNQTTMAALVDISSHADEIFVRLTANDNSNMMFDELITIVADLAQSIRYIAAAVAVDIKDNDNDNR